MTPPVDRLRLAAPPLAALFYPFLLKAFHRAVSPGDAHVALAAFTLLLAVAVPAAGIAVCAQLGRLRQMTMAELQLKRIALLSIAAPPLYTTTGVVIYAVKSSVSDLLVWIIVWIPVTAGAAWAAMTSSAPAPVPKTAASARLRYAHGTAAALIVLAFLAMHLTNHLTALWSEQAHRHVMDLFRVVYRARFIEPLVVALFLFQVASGATLLWPYVRRPSDIFRTLQIATGAYLFFYVLGHLNSVFVARVITKTQTDFAWATGAPLGLIHDPWSIRLLPHYLIAVFFVLSHLVLGARGIALAHDMPRERADLLARIGIGVAAVVAAAIMTGLCGLRFGE